MKKIRIVLVWVIISLVVQGLVLFTLEKTIFKTNSDVELKKEVIEEDNSEKDAHIKVSQDANKIKFSYNGEYVAFFDKEDFNVINTATGEAKKLELSETFKVSSYSWLQDRNRMIIVGREEKKSYKMYSIDIDSSQYKELELSSISTNLKIEEISPSTKTGIVYLKAVSKDGVVSAYRINNDDMITKVTLNNNKVNGMVVLPSKDRLIYESNQRKFYITQPNEPIALPDNGTYKLLGVDYENSLYIGKVNKEEKIESIYSKTMNSSEDIKKVKWSEMKLEVPVYVENIYLDQKACQIYVNDINNSKLINTTTIEEYEYKGKVVDVYSKGFATVDSNGKMTKTMFKKNKQ